jgi:hypothetical protein
MLVTEGWKEEFMQKVNAWAKSCEWLYDNISGTRDQSTVTEPLRYVGKNIGQYKSLTIMGK